MSIMFTSRNITSALVAIAFTFALHGGWLAAMDRDAVAVTTPAHTA
jgi:hypothetical protein